MNIKSRLPRLALPQGSLALHLASRDGSEDCQEYKTSMERKVSVIKVLLEAGADKEAKDVS